MLAHLDRIWSSTWRPARHRSAARQLRVTRLPGPGGLRLAGEVDLATHDQLAGALAAYRSAYGEGGELHLWLDRLRFIDVHGAGLIALSGHRVVLHRPPEPLSRMAELLWPGVFSPPA